MLTGFTASVKLVGVEKEIVMEGIVNSGEGYLQATDIFFFLEMPGLGVIVCVLMKGMDGGGPVD